jgi:hypothetical protein
MNNITNVKKITIIVILKILILLTLSSIFYYVSLPKEATDVKNLISDRETYLEKVYIKSSGLIQTDNLNWLWETAPKSMLCPFPIANNLSFIWPPKKGERFKMTAFPYPDTGKSKFWLFQFIQGMKSLLDNTSDKVTFPGWQISIYDPLEPNFNSWQKFLNNNTDPITGINTQPIYIEVTHSCYAPPNKTYPTCDDGGYWLYGTSGSGVFWKSSGTHLQDKTLLEKKSMCLIANNKIDAIFKLWNYAIKTKNFAAIEVARASTGLDENSKAEDYIVARLKNTGGGLKLMKALQTIINASKNGRQIPSITAWRTMEPSNSKKSWRRWILYSIFLVAIWYSTVFGFFYVIYLSIKNRKTEKWWKSIIIIFSVLIAVILGSFILYKIEWNFVSETMFDKFGYKTMDMALKKSNLNLKEFVFSAAGIDTDYKNLEKNKYNPITNGLAQVQIFDFDLSYFSSLLNIDSVIMHAQPNLSGSWSVEILDVRNTPAAGSKSLDDLIFKLGLCGQPIDKETHPLMPELLKGPVSETNGVYFGYQPNSGNLCNCDDSVITKQYNNGKGDLKKCVYCHDTLSDTLC